jgi:hypothetical protein
MNRVRKTMLCEYNEFKGLSTLLTIHLGQPNRVASFRGGSYFVEVVHVLGGTAKYLLSSIRKSATAWSKYN